MKVMRYLAIAGLIFLAGSSTTFADDDNDSATGQHDPRLVELDAKALEIAAIRSVAAEPRRYRPEFNAYGEVLDLAPLINLRLQSMTVKLRHDSAAEKNRLSRAGMARLEDLHRSDAVSTRRLQEQMAQWQTDRAVAGETALQQRMTIVSSLQQWGNTLTDWFTRPSSAIADDIIADKKQLLRITLPAGKPLPDGIQTVSVAIDGEPRPLAAQWVDNAPQVDPLTRGRQYFFLIERGGLPAGLRVTARIPDIREAIDGVLIPRDALLWHLGEAFVYIDSGKGRYLRRIVDNQRETDGGYFVSEGIRSGEKVVVSGAQTLLSQHLRNRIPDEDDED